MTFRDFQQDARIEGLEAEHRAADGVTTDVIGSLAAQVSALKAEVARQNAALSVLTQLLMESGVVDGAQLGARFQQATKELQAQANRIACARCRKQVDKRTTQITSSGALCDVCFAAMMADD
jgi:hypothetical protein